MLAKFFLALAALAPLALAAPLKDATVVETTRRGPSCDSGAYIIVARGSTEPQGEGPLQTVSGLIEQGVAGSTDIAVVYPAALIPYETSESEGVTNMTQLITSYVAACPNGKIVLMGYSQGGQIVSDVLGGGSYKNTPPLDHAKYSKNIAAAVTFGDPSQVAGQSWDKGNATRSGIFKRKNIAALSQWSGVLGAWCQANDFFCDSGVSFTIHDHEVQTYGAAVAQFVIGLVNSGK